VFHFPQRAPVATWLQEDRLFFAGSAERECVEQTRHRAREIGYRIVAISSVLHAQCFAVEAKRYQQQLAAAMFAGGHGNRSNFTGVLAWCGGQAEQKLTTEAGQGRIDGGVEADGGHVLDLESQLQLDRFQSVGKVEVVV
jgi:hypothetical protein